MRNTALFSPLCHAPLVVARKRRLHDHLHCRRVVGRERIDGVEYVVDREVVVAAVVQVARDALALVVQTRYVEHVAAVQQRRGGVGEDDRAQRLVAELVSYAVDAHRLALPDGVGHGDAAGAAACRCGMSHRRRSILACRDMFGCCAPTCASAPCRARRAPVLSCA